MILLYAAFSLQYTLNVDWLRYRPPGSWNADALHPCL